MFGLESWVVSSSMDRKVEGTHTEFLQQIVVKCVWKNPDRTWLTPLAGEVLETEGMHLVATYIVLRNNKVSQCMLLRPIFELSSKEMGFEVGGGGRGGNRGRRT